MGNACLEVLKPGDANSNVMDISRHGSYPKTTDSKVQAGLEVPEVILVKGISKASIQTPNSSDDDQLVKKPKLGLKIPAGPDYPVSAAEGLDSPNHYHKVPSLQQMIPDASTVSLIPSNAFQFQQSTAQTHQQMGDSHGNGSTNDGTAFNFQHQSAIQVTGPGPIQSKVMNKWYMMHGATSDVQLLSAIREEQSAMEESHANFGTLGPSRFASSRNNLP